MERMKRDTPTLLLGAALVVGFAMTLVLTREMTFFQDTWAFLIDRREITLDTLLQPHNEHIVVIPVLLEQLLLRVFGMSNALPEYILLSLFLIVTALLVYVYVRRRVGGWLALFAAVLLLCLGPAWEVLLWPFEITFIGPILFGLAMLLALERGDRRSDVLACVFLVCALGFSGLGICFIAAAAVAVAQGPRESWLRRAYIFAIPLALYALWWLGWGHEAESHLSLHNLLVSPVFVLDSVAVALGSMVGLGTQVGAAADPSWGRALLVGLVIVLGLRQWLLKKPLYPALWPALAAALANWFLTAFNAFPGRDPTSSRYQYAGAVFILLILANLLKGVRPSRNVLIAGAIVTVCAIGPNLVILKAGRDILDPQSVLTRADTGALEIARRTVPEGFQLSPEVAGTPSLVNIYAGEYLAAADEYGSPAYTPQELLAAPEPARKQADIILSQALPLSTVTRLGAYSPGAGGAGCVDVAPNGSGPGEVRLAPGLNRIELAPGPHADFTLRRFAAGEYPVSTEGADGDSVTLLRVPRDASKRPWFLHVAASQPARVCD
jgi:hypothetical protein